MSSGHNYDLTVIIPTYKEEQNIRDIINEIQVTLDSANIDGEILVVDDNSPDNTRRYVIELMGKLPNLSLHTRMYDHGLSQSVADGFARAQSDICMVVIDADFSHPVNLIPKMYEEIRNGNDIVIGSRYMEGGGIKQWPLKRRIISLGATFLGRLLFPDITDPVSGFFALRKSVISNADLKPKGYKILLEVLGKGQWEHDKEIPYEFNDRTSGLSKLSPKVIVDYANQVIDIFIYSIINRRSAVRREWKRAIKFGLVGLSGIVINEGVLIALKEFLNIAIPVASLVAIELSVINNFIWNNKWTFKGAQTSDQSTWIRLLKFHLVSGVGVIINFSILNGLPLLGYTTDYKILNIAGILLAFVWNFTMARRIVWKRKE